MATDDDDQVKVGLNEVGIQFMNQLVQDTYIFTQYETCEKCPYNNVSLLIEAGKNVTKLYRSDLMPLRYAVSTENHSNPFGNMKCESVIHAQEHSLHRVVIENTCRTEIIEEGRNEFYFLFIALALIPLVTAAFYFIRYMLRRYKDDVEEDETLEAKLSTRQNCLDAFRGITILLMIFVNWGSGEYLELDHAPWNGLRFADFIFPCFIFIMGVTMSISLRSMVIKKDMPLGQIYMQILVRSVKLFLVGIILGSMGHPDIRNLRIPGVLQRFAVSYFIVAAVHVVSLHLSRDSNKYIIPFWPDWILAGVMLLIYFVLTFAWKFDENCPAGYVGPGGLSDNAQHPYCTGGAAAKLDELIFTKKHIYKYFTAADLYDPVIDEEEKKRKYGVSHDPEGLLGCTTSIVLTIIGLQIGKIILAYEFARDRLIRMSIWVLLLSALAAIFAATGWIPINKNLWSFTFICVTGAVAISVFALFYIVIDHFKIWPRGTPLHYPGMNSILLYIGHDFTSSILPFAFVTESETHFWFLLQNITGVTMWLLISVYLAKKNIFFTL